MKAGAALFDRNFAELYGLALDQITPDFKTGTAIAREIIDRHFRGRSLDTDGALFERGCDRPLELGAFTRREIARRSVPETADFTRGVEAEIARQRKTIRAAPGPRL